MEKVLFEVKYPAVDWSEKLDSEPPAEKASHSDAMEFLDKLLSERTLVLLPSRAAGSKRFIALAKQVAEMYQIDTKITEHDSHITVSYSFYSTGGMVGLINVIEMADEISFLHNNKGKPITVILEYYTHAEYMRNRLVAPLDRKGFI